MPDADVESAAGFGLANPTLAQRLGRIMQPEPAIEAQEKEAKIPSQPQPGIERYGLPRASLPRGLNRLRSVAHRPHPHVARIKEKGQNE